MRQVFSNAWAMISLEYWMAAMISAPYRGCLKIPKFEDAIGLLDCLGDDLSGVLDSGHDLCSCKMFFVFTQDICKLRANSSYWNLKYCFYYT
jgi:hypothetical protein